MDAKTALVKLFTRVLPNWRYLPRSAVRTCRACRRTTLFLCIGEADEFKICVRCRANLRYEMLATYLGQLNLSAARVLELDYGSPLRSCLSKAQEHIQSFYRPEVPRGALRHDGAICQDITCLTYPTESIDVIVSSDVLEHVPDAHAAFRESARVLKPGGIHLFTVPPTNSTRPRAVVENGGIRHLTTPEYHRDPLDPRGILAFWDFGPDIPEYFADSGLTFRVVMGPEGADKRIVWEARKP